ncbi:MAG: hypothetical protein KC636_08590 [Myxococcales bacterium]|nr:hypothetical protein [Myxococcales bacterium]
MTVRPRWYVYVLGALIYGPAVFMAWVGDWRPLLALLALPALALLFVAAIIGVTRVRGDGDA